jgi:hypothetical protein
MQTTVIEWDGSNVPPELHRLPPGRYVLAPLEDTDGLTSTEDAAVRQGLDDLAAGNTVPFEEVRKALGSRQPRA